MNLKILAVESSCDDTSVAIVENGRKVQGCETFSQVEKHKIFGGVVPEIASRNHIESIANLVKILLSKSKIKFNELDGLAVTYGPGLVGSLLVGVNFVKGLSIATGLPIVPVHHVKAHVAALYLTYPELEPPFLCLVVSGGHTYILEVLGYADVKIISRTRDDSVGEAFDKIGRKLGLDHPGGVHLDKLAENGNPGRVKLPIPLKFENTYDFSFSGLKTAMINIINNLNQKQEMINTEDMAASFRQHVVEYLISNFVQFAEKNNYKKLAIAGGVSANLLLRRELEEICLNKKWQLFKPRLEFCGDNAAMVASQAFYEYQKNNFATLDLNAISSESL